MATLLWVSIALIVYTYAGYPVLVALLSKLRKRPTCPVANVMPHSVSILIAAFNEESTIQRRVQELVDSLEDIPANKEIILVSDGSTDNTAELARAVGNKMVQVIELGQNTGKSAAIARARDIAVGEVLVFADARQSWRKDAMRNLLARFSDPTIGAVGGELVLSTSDGVSGGIGLYWTYEKWIRRSESRLHSTVGVSGAIAAVRRELYRPPAAGTVLDDVYWPLLVVMQGRRVAFEENALAFDSLPVNPREEFSRKVRTLAGNFQLAALLPSALVPVMNPICWQFWSHKMLRLLAPWALIAILISSAILAGPLYRLLFASQAVFYGCAVLGLMSRNRIPNKLLSLAGSFVLLNAAAIAGFWIWVTGRTAQSWRKTTYRPDTGVSQ